MRPADTPGEKSVTVGALRAVFKPKNKKLGLCNVSHDEHESVCRLGSMYERKEDGCGNGKGRVQKK